MFLERAGTTYTPVIFDEVADIHLEEGLQEGVARHGIEQHQRACYCNIPCTVGNPEMLRPHACQSARYINSDSIAVSCISYCASMCQLLTIEAGVKCLGCLPEPST